jgi:soluble lytic murein transglycosylase-like protein
MRISRRIAYTLALVNDFTLTLAAYNAGEGAVRKYGNQVPPYPETQDYVRKVMAKYDRLVAEQAAGQR